MPADNFWDAGAVKVRIAGVFPFGREDQEEILAEFEAAVFDRAEEFLIGGARIGGALEADELIGAEMRENAVPRGAHVAKVRLVVEVQRRGHADDDHIHLRDAGEVGGGAELAGLDGVRHALRADVLDVALPGIEGVHFLHIHVEADDLDVLLSKAEDERKADVAESEDADDGGAIGEFVFGCHGWEMEWLWRPAKGAPGPVRRSNSWSAMAVTWSIL